MVLDVFGYESGLLTGSAEEARGMKAIDLVDETFGAIIKALPTATTDADGCVRLVLPEEIPPGSPEFTYLAQRLREAGVTATPCENGRIALWRNGR